MSPDTESTPAPQPLSPFDVDLLTDFVSGHDPLALAASRNMTLAALLAWRNRPEIHQFIAGYQQLVEESTSLLAASVRNTLITELIDLVQATPDLLEKRRAAQTLQRLISRPRRRAANLHSTGTPTTPSTTPSPSAASSPSNPSTPVPHISASPNPLPTGVASFASPVSPSCSSCSSCSTSQSDPSSSAAPLPDPVSVLLKPDGTIDLAALTALAARFEAQDDQTLDDSLDYDLDSDPDDDPDPPSHPAARRGGSSSRPAPSSPALYSPPSLNAYAANSS